MNRISYLLVSLFLLSSVSLTQEQIKPNPEFYHTWLWTDFYESLMNNKTPYELYPLPIHTMQLYFDKDENEVFYGTFHEGITKRFRVISNDTIEIIDAENKSKKLIIYLSEIMGQPNLVINDEGKTFFYSALNDKYNFRDGVHSFINDKFFTGNYNSEDDSTQKITFTSDGKVMGIDNFNEYTLPIEGVPLPREYDIALFFVVNKTTGRRDQKLTTMMHWEKSNDKITLYNVSSNVTDEYSTDGKFIGAKILDKYLTLKKVD